MEDEQTKPSTPAYSLRPTKFNEEIFGWVKFAARLEKKFLFLRKKTQGNIVAELQGYHGSGKSLFFRLWERRYNDHGSAKGVVVQRFDMAREDFRHPPLLALSEMLAETSFGDNADNANALEAWKISGENRFPTAIRDAIHDNMKSSLLQIVLLDGLDDCPPEYASDCMHAVKYSLDAQGIVFVVATAIPDHTAAESRDRDFKRMLDSLRHFTVELPEVSDKRLRSYVSMLMEEYLPGVLTGKVREAFVVRLTILFARFRLSLKQMELVVIGLSSVWEREYPGSSKLACLRLAALLCCFKLAEVGSVERLYYRRLGTGRLDGGVDATSSMDDLAGLLIGKFTEGKHLSVEAAMDWLALLEYFNGVTVENVQAVSRLPLSEEALAVRSKASEYYRDIKPDDGENAIEPVRLLRQVYADLEMLR